MNINTWRYSQLTDEQRRIIFRRSETDIESLMHGVKEITDDVRDRGDQALIDFNKKFDNADVPLDAIKVTPEEFEEARKTLDDDVKRAIDICADNVRAHHESQMKRVEKRWMEEVKPGIWAGEQINAIPSVGIYVPRGKGAFPSVMFMTCVAAKVAGVPDIHVVTPPRPDGKADDASLYAACVSGVKNVYKVGGAQAVAALAYGTETIPKVAKVIGPGSPYVAAAKRLLSSGIDPGMPAGPSESIIVADGFADPWNTALDLLNEAEHGDDSAAILVTSDETLAENVKEALINILADMPDKQRNICEDVLAGYGGIMLTDNDEESAAFCNDYAVEHLYLHVENTEWWLDHLCHAGEIIIGDVTTISMANYGVGVNHVLPTGGNAKTYSCTSVWDFLKRTSLAKMDRHGFDAIKDPVVTLAHYEDFPAHANSITKRRFKD